MWKNLIGVAVLLFGVEAQAKENEVYLFYNAASADLSEIGIAADETAVVFEDVFGPATDELPDKVKIEDFFVSKFADGTYVFTLNAGYNCAQLGCATETYRRDSDGDLMPAGSTFPVKCTGHDADKMLCVKGGYQPAKPKPAVKRRRIVHYPAPAE